MLVWLILLDAATSFDPVTWFVNYGVAGAVIALVVIGKLRTKPEVDGLKDQLAEARKDAREATLALQALVKQITDHTLPQLVQTARLVESLPAKSTDADELAQLKARLERVEQGGK